MPDTPLSRWLRQEMPRKGFPLEGPRAGGISRLADEAGISRAALSRIVNGQAAPETTSLRRIGRVLGYNLREMLIFAELAEPDELADTTPKPLPVELEPIDHDRVSVEVSIDPDLSIEDAIRIVEEATGRALSKDERILVNTLELMQYPPDEVAGMVLLSRRLAARRAQQDLRQVRKRA